jgi:hypothetical protein
MPPIPTPSKTYLSKHGTIILYNGENYADWSRTTKGALAMCGALDLSKKPLVPNQEVSDAHKLRIEAGTKVIYNSVLESYQEAMIVAMGARDLKGMMDVVENMNQALDPTSTTSYTSNSHNWPGTLISSLCVSSFTIWNSSNEPSSSLRLQLPILICEENC